MKKVLLNIIKILVVIVFLVVIVWLVASLMNKENYAKLAGIPISLAKVLGYKAEAKQQKKPLQQQWLYSYL